MNLGFIKGALVAVFILISMALSAQPGGGGGGIGSGGPPPSTGAPIDGGASIFLAAVAGYVYRQQKKNME